MIVKRGKTSRHISRALWCVIMSRIVVLLNPFAGREKASREIPRLESELRRHSINYDLLVPQSEDHLKAIAAERSQDGELILGAGGDGTFNAIVNEMVKTSSNAIFGMINLGTRGDIAREFGTGTLEEACQAIKAGVYRLTDVAVLNYD